MSEKRLLAVLAHPDDESYGPGGTLAKYAHAGYEVHIAIATDGAAGSIAEGHEEARENLADVRAKELEAAVKILKGTLHPLGFQDSGMQGDPSNDHPNAFIHVADSIAVRKIVELIRTYRPQVVITHDETGGYFHPDHIRCYEITTAAFHAAPDPAQYADLGLEPYQPERLYYTAVPKGWIKFAIFMMRLRGLDPSKMGRNKDIDLTKLGIPSERIHAYLDIRPTWDVKRAASAEHKTQGGGTSFGRIFPNWLQKQMFGRESFIRAYPPTPDHFQETDLFPANHSTESV